MKAVGTLLVALMVNVGVQGFLLPQTRLDVRPSSITSSALAAAAATTTTSSSDSFVGSKLTDMQLAYEAAAKFFDSTEGVEFKQTSGGVNNVRQRRKDRYTDGAIQALNTRHYTHNFIRSACTCAFRMGGIMS